MADENDTSSTRLFVSGLHVGTTDTDIRKHFEPFGRITDIYILSNKNKKASKSHSRGCCFVGFFDVSDAEKARKRCHQTFLGTRRINVSFALQKQSATTTHPHSIPQLSTTSKTTPKPAHAIAASSNQSNSDESKKEYEQFLRLTKSTNSNLVTSFLNESDGEDSAEDDDIVAVADDHNANQEEAASATVDDEATTEEEAPGDNDKQQPSTIIDDTAVTEIFIRNLPFISTEDDLYQFFHAFGAISQVFLPLDDFGKVKGYGFVQFDSNECVQKLFQRYQHSLRRDRYDKHPMISLTLNGRNVHVLPSNYKYRELYCVNGREISYDDLDDELKSSLSFKQLRDLKLKHNAKNDVNWNTFFIPTDNILRHNAKQLNTTKSQLLGVDNHDSERSNNMAVTTALAETAVVSKTKNFLAEHGIDVEKFNQSKARTIRSRAIILVKNFPYNSTRNELKEKFEKFGQIAKLVLPETKACAIVEYLNAKDAQTAFHSLAYSKFKHLPMFLEWAPINLFLKSENSEISKALQTTEEAEEGTDSDAQRHRKRTRSHIENGADPDEDVNKTKVIVKNIAFEADKKELEQLFGVYGKIKSIRIPRKFGGGHRGFCFIEFDTNKEAINAKNALSASHFYGRHLVIQWANSLNESPTKKTRIE